MYNASVGWAPSVRLMTSHTVRSGKSSLQSVTRLRANAYSIGPLVPSETRRRYHPEDGRLCANATTVSGATPSGATTRCERMAPLYLEVFSVVTGRWSHHRGSEGIDTNDVTPTQASMASRKSGLLP